ncbi:MAG: hypothetical protein BJ554DRAFT_6695 [Olpidium bornovanus]|uniref:Uncharacterized protein n=1 Tax=Olpidium bornovanus TaxID=278681 RepID=A0A8H7ZX93_9FUNG|nr:MAG: hypothetical protein BJ554DRAFT_6695 [Olpidium bornovanus]
MLPDNATKRMRRARQELRFRPLSGIGHIFSDETKARLNVNKDGLLAPIEEDFFRNCLAARGRAFSFTESEMGCVDPSVVTPLIIFAVPHEPWNLQPIPVPKAHYQSQIDSLQQRIKTGVLCSVSSAYSNRCFTVPKKNGSLRFIQDLQPVNLVTIQSCAIGPPPDAFSENFAGRSIYSVGDLFSGYDQFQLAQES